MAKLGYTWYPKDWGNSDSVFELTLTERGLYRELIDMAMMNDNKTIFNIKTWSRKFGSTEKEIDLILNTLCRLNLIEIIDDYLIIPSCESRLNLSRGGKKGGEKSKPTQKPLKSLDKKNLKPTIKQREREREIESKIEIENNVVVDEIDINEKFENDFSDFKISYYVKSQNLNFSLENEIVIFTTHLQKSKNEFEKKLFKACLEFLEFEKRKKVPPKKENNIDTANELKISSEWLEAMAMQFKVSIEKISNKLDEFLLHLKTDCKEHTSRGEFIKHFKSWLQKNMSNGTGEAKQSINFNGKQQFRFSTDNAIKTITSNSK